LAYAQTLEASQSERFTALTRPGARVWPVAPTHGAKISGNTGDRRLHETNRILEKSSPARSMSPSLCHLRSENSQSGIFGQHRETRETHPKEGIAHIGRTRRRRGQKQAHYRWNPMARR